MQKKTEEAKFAHKKKWKVKVSVDVEIKVEVEDAVKSIVQVNGRVVR